MNRLDSLYSNIKDDLIIDHDGCTVYSKSSIELSPGCLSCKKGTWVCLTMGLQCNASCTFCDKPKTKHPMEKTGFYWDKSLKTITNSIINKETPVEGVSFSGGEPLLYLDNIEYVSKELTLKAPWIYKWLYTNALLLSEETIRILKNAGINEIRVNLGATNFSDETLEKIKAASKIIDRMTVEVPSLQSTYDKLIDENKIEKIIECGITQLNLAEYFYRNGYDDRFSEGGVYQHENTLYSPVRSREFTAKIMKYVINNKLPLLVNDCSMAAKLYHNKVRKHLNLE